MHANTHHSNCSVDASTRYLAYNVYVIAKILSCEVGQDETFCIKTNSGIHRVCAFYILSSPTNTALKYIRVTFLIDAILFTVFFSEQLLCIFYIFFLISRITVLQKSRHFTLLFEKYRYSKKRKSCKF